MLPLQIFYKIIPNKFIFLKKKVNILEDKTSAERLFQTTLLDEQSITDT